MQEDAKAKESQSRSSTDPISDYASPVAPFPTDASVSEVIAHGLNALDRSDFDQAIVIFQAVSGACPEVPLFHAVHALALFQNGKIPEALRALLRAEKLDSTNERVLEVAKVLAPWQSTTIAPTAQYASEHPSTSVVHQCEFSAPGLSSSFPKAYEISGLSMHGPLGLIVGERQKLLLETAVDGNIDLAILPLARDKLALNAPTTRPGRFIRSMAFGARASFIGWLNGSPRLSWRSDLVLMGPTSFLPGDYLSESRFGCLEFLTIELKNLMGNRGVPSEH